MTTTSKSMSMVVGVEINGLEIRVTAFLTSPLGAV